MKSLLLRVLSETKEHKLTIVLTLIAIVILGYPLVIYGINKTFFYGIDPDVVYTTNALLYTKAKIITYMDHPGTPSIVLLSLYFTPLRLIAKYILHQNFIDWSFYNYAFLTYYLRIFQLITVGVALYIFLSSIRKFTKSIMLTIIAFCLLFSIGGVTSALLIIPENLSCFLTAVWLSVLVIFLRKRGYFQNVILAGIAGLAFANKFTSLFLVIISIFLAFYIKKSNVWQRVLMLGSNIFIAVGTFILGVQPIWGGLKNVGKWGLSLFYHAGVHGTGTSSIFDWNTYLNSFFLLIRYNVVAFVFIVLTVISGIYLLIKRKIKASDPVILVLFTSFTGVLIFAKYSLMHYQFVNIFLLIFCAIYFLLNIDLRLKLICLIAALSIFLTTSVGYLKYVSARSVGSTESVRNVLQTWTPHWAADIFRDQLKESKP